MLARIGRLLLMISTVTTTTSALARDCPTENWPLWNSYVKAFSSPDGRFIDRSLPDHRTTSEAQAYALFFSLVANDRDQFDRILRWTEHNLAKGDLRANLPAWRWGKDDQGQWRILEDIAASDADLWIIYALVEAGRLWCEPRYVILAEQMAALVGQREVRDLPNLGYMLLPGTAGFELDADTWRLNPSYLPLFLLRRLEGVRLTGPWSIILRNTLRMFREAATKDGFIGDWVIYHRTKGFQQDGAKERISSYDAIRTYLWAGMVADGDPDKAAMADRIRGLLLFARRVGRVPEKVDGVIPPDDANQGPPGFQAALLPMAQDVGDAELQRRLTAELASQRKDGLYGNPPRYYDQNLVLFAEGFVEGRYRFAPDGRLEPRWYQACRQVADPVDPGRTAVAP